MVDIDLKEIADSEKSFGKFVRDYIDDFAYAGALLVPVYSQSRIVDTYRFWTQDVERLRTFSLPTNTVPDHFKQAAHLMYWLRRQAPVIDYLDAESIQDGGGSKITPREEKVRELLFQCGSEFLAFDIGYQICWAYESDSAGHQLEFALDEDYIETVCCFLKEKNVSPHAMYLVFKSLFYHRS